MLASINGLFRLSRDGELRYSASSTAIFKMGLACSEKRGDKENQLFIDATAFGGLAETLNTYAGSKGTQLYVRGKIQTEMWTDQQGQKQSKISMIVEGFDFVGKRVDNAPKDQPYQQPQVQHQNVPQDNQSNYVPQQQQAPQQQQMNYQPQNSIPEYDVDDPDSEIPF